MKPPLGFYVHARGVRSRDPEVPEVPGPALPVFAVIGVARPVERYDGDLGVEFLCQGFAYAWVRVGAHETVLCTGPGCRACAASGGQPPQGFEL